MDYLRKFMSEPDNHTVAVLCIEGGMGVLENRRQQLLAVAGYYFENEEFQLFRAISFGYVDKNVDFFCANWSCFPKMN